MTDVRIHTDLPDPTGFSWPDASDIIVHARDLLMFITTRFWTPIALKALPGVLSKRRKEFLAWFKPVELMLRRVLMIEALTLSATLPPPQSGAHAKHSTPAPTLALLLRPRPSHRYVVNRDLDRLAAHAATLLPQPSDTS